MSLMCAHVSMCRWQRVNVSKEGGGGEIRGKKR